MSAIPKKKLCWNCEGNVAREIDNCPYCGVYMHSLNPNEENDWNVPYDNKTEEIPSPLYQIQESEDSPESEVPSLVSSNAFQQIKENVLPIFLLMSGSMFFLFGLVLLLFSNQGTLTLQWNGNNWPYFLIFSLPCVYFGWKYLLQLNQQDDETESLSD